MDWQPIRTAPKDRAIELATFPARDGDNKPNLFIGDAAASAPNATHWREVTQETAEAMAKAWPNDLRS